MPLPPPVTSATLPANIVGWKGLGGVEADMVLWWRSAIDRAALADGRYEDGAAAAARQATACPVPFARPCNLACALLLCSTRAVQHVDNGEMSSDPVLVVQSRSRARPC